MNDPDERDSEPGLLALLPRLSVPEEASDPHAEMPRRKRTKSTPDWQSPVLDDVAPEACREDRVDLLMKISEMRENVPEGCSIGVFQRPDKTYFAIYVAAEKEPRGRAKKVTHKKKPVGDHIKKTRKARQSQQQLMREEGARLAAAIAATAPGGAASKDAVVDAPPFPAPVPAPSGMGRGKGLMYADQDVLGMGRRVYGDTIPLVENPTHSGVIAIPDTCACPCGCKSTETPAKSARLDMTSKKRACNSCTLNQGRRMKACWDKQDESVKRRIMEEEEGGAASAEAMAG